MSQAPSGSPDRVRYVVRTLGCKANLYDSQLIEAEFKRRGVRPLAGEGELDAQVGGSDTPVVCVVNSCTVTDEADRQSRRMASRLSREYPGSLVVVTGCASEVDPERLSRSKGVSYVVGNRDKPEMVSLILSKLAERSSGQAESETAQDKILGSATGYTEMLSRHPIDREWPLVTDETFDGQLPTDAFSEKTRAFLKIQEGCNSFCTYCIIPYGRGPSRSLTEDEVIARIERLVAAGVREVVLTGTNLGDYGTDLSEATTFDALCEAIVSRTRLERLRLSSLDPVEITPRLLELMKREPRLVPHFHVSLQSANSKVLRLMKRKYREAELIRTLNALPSVLGPHGPAFVGMDVITGFPGESDEDFEQSVELLSRLYWSRLHVFPYSERSGTPATRLPDEVPVAVRKDRARRLQALSLERLQSQTHEIAQTLFASQSPIRGILVERSFAAPADYFTDRPNRRVIVLDPNSSVFAAQTASSEWFAAGYTADYRRVLMPMPETSRNEIVDARVVGYLVDHASGEASLIAERFTAP